MKSPSYSLFSSSSHFVDSKVNVRGLFPNAFELEDNVSDPGAVSPNDLLERVVGPLTTREVHVVQIPQILIAKEVGETERRDVVRVEQEQLFKFGQGPDELEPEGRDVLHVAEAQLPQLVTLADLLAHGVVVVPPLEPQNLDRVSEAGDDQSDSPPVEVTVQHQFLQVRADLDDGLRVVVAQGCQRPEEGQGRELGEGHHEAGVLHVGPEVVVLPVVFVTADEREHLDVRTGHAQPGQGLGAE